RPYPCAVHTVDAYYFIIKTVCPVCRQDCVLFHNHLHGAADLLELALDEPENALPRLWPWRCLECGSALHRGCIGIVSDYKDRFFSEGYAERLGADRWCDAFGCFRLSIKCCGCGYDTNEWVYYETR